MLRIAFLLVTAAARRLCLLPARGEKEPQLIRRSVFGAKALCSSGPYVIDPKRSDPKATDLKAEDVKAYVDLSPRPAICAAFHRCGRRQSARHIARPRGPQKPARRWICRRHSSRQSAL